MERFYGDLGHSDAKVIGPAGEVKFEHAFYPLSTAQFQDILQRTERGRAGKEVMVINGKPYIFGAAAHSYGVPRQKKGADRYQSDYYGIMAAASMVMAGAAGGNVIFIGSHPPRDVGYRNELMESVYGDWVVICDGDQIDLHVKWVNAFDEGIGGWAYRFIRPDGGGLYDVAAKDRLLVLDIGGGTFSLLGIRNGRADYGVQESVDTGVNDVIRALERLVRDRYKDRLRSTTSIETSRWHSALRDQRLTGGGYQLDCAAEVEQATLPLMKQIYDAVQYRAGGVFNWDHILLTGGGTALLADRVVDLLGHGSFFMASSTMGDIEFANVRGLQVLHNLLEG